MIIIISKRWRVTATFFALADHVTQTGYIIKWDHFDILATGESNLHYKIKETLLIRDLKPAFNENVGRLFSFTFSLSLLTLFGISVRD